MTHISLLSLHVIFLYLLFVLSEALVFLYGSNIVVLWIMWWESACMYWKGVAWYGKGSLQLGLGCLFELGVGRLTSGGWPGGNDIGMFSQD